MNEALIIGERPIRHEQAATRPLRVPSPWRRCSVRLTMIVALLTAFGLVMSVSAARADELAPMLAKRLLLTGLAIMGFLMAARIDYRTWRRHHLGLLLVAVAALAALFVPGLAMAKNGARRWMNTGLPLGLQPSEFAKLSLCVWTAAYCERNLREMGSFVRGFLAPLTVIGATCMLILWEPDFGTAVLIGAVCACVLLVMGARLTFALLIAAASFPLAYQLVFGVPYRLRRVLVFLNPWDDPRGAGYQLIQSLVAIGSGGVRGLGLGMSQQKEAFLPGATNDFVFSVVAEELGFIGAALLIALFCLLLWESLKVIRRSRSPFAFALSTGLTLLLGVQAAAHIAVASGSVPTKGLALPFISAGGSSLIASMIAAGILVNIARAGEDPEYEPSPWEDEAPAYEVIIRRVLDGMRQIGGRMLAGVANMGGAR